MVFGVPLLEMSLVMVRRDVASLSLSTEVTRAGRVAEGSNLTTKGVLWGNSLGTPGRKVRLRLKRTG